MDNRGCLFLGLKIFLGFFLSAILLVGWFVVWFVLTFNSANRFYPIVVTVFAIVLWLFLIMQTGKLLKPKIRYISVSVAVGAIMLSVIIFEAINAYHNSFETIYEQGVNLSLYSPFDQDTLAVSLNEASTLTITDNHPKIDGATALYPVYSAFVKAAYANVNDNAYDGDVEVTDLKPIPADKYGVIECTNTSGAYNRLISGEADIIFVAGPSARQREMAKEANVELNFTPIGREAFVFFVNVKNPINDISVDDIRNIYAGNINNWSEVGGRNSSIRAFQRPDNSGSQTALINLMGDTPLMIPPKEDVATGMGGIISEVSSYRNYNNAIGYSFLFFATEMVKDNNIKLVALNGVMPTRESIANKTYPYASEFYAVTAGTQNPNVEKFIEWILSEQGQYIIAETGYTPVVNKE